jgi:hypothetical protein
MSGMVDCQIATYGHVTEGRFFVVLSRMGTRKQRRGK